MFCKTVLKKILVISLFTFPILASSGILNVGFDIDDTVLFSRDVFLNIPENKRNPIDYGWVNTQDEKLSIFIDESKNISMTGPVSNIDQINIKI